jgi:hypothetical protein
LETQRHPAGSYNNTFSMEQESVFFCRHHEKPVQKKIQLSAQSAKFV